MQIITTPLAASDLHQKQSCVRNILSDTVTPGKAGRFVSDITGFAFEAT